MSKAVYLVSSGNYSDYHIDAAFSTKELAQAWIDAHETRSWYDIEEHLIDEEAGWVERQLHQCVIRLSDGAVQRQQGYKYMADPNVRSLPSEIYGNECAAKSYVSAEHALKLAVEARQEHIRVKP